jgi:3-methyladenine DNA glycosylase AlkD
MTKDEVLSELQKLGTEQTKKVYQSHGASEPLFGVKLSDLSGLKRKIKTDHGLAMELFQTGNSDAMYLAGLIEDPAAVTQEQLDQWTEAADWDMLSERCVAVVAAKTPFGFEMARKWIESSREMTACAGYAVYSTLFTVLNDKDIDMDEVKALFVRIEQRIHQEHPQTQNAMNNCLIMAGIYIQPLHSLALETAQRIGRIKPVIAQNSCNIQSAEDYLKKYADKGKIGIKIKNLGR